MIFSALMNVSFLFVFPLSLSFSPSLFFPLSFYYIFLSHTHPSLFDSHLLTSPQHFLLPLPLLIMILSHSARSRERRKINPLSIIHPLLVLLCHTPNLTHAQSQPPKLPTVVPTSVQEMAYMRAGPSFYVQGGKVVRQKNDYAISPQLYALDISISWATDSPPWMALTAGPTYNLYNGVTSPDNKTLTTLFQEQTTQLLVNQYSLETNTWKYSFVGVNENLRGIRPVLDPTSGLIYIQGQQNMIILDPRTMSIQPYPIAKTTMPSRSFPGAVYHPGRKSILYLGGFSPEGIFEARTYVNEYMIAANSWGVFVSVQWRRGNKNGVSDNKEHVLLSGMILMPCFSHLLSSVRRRQVRYLHREQTTA